MVDGVIKSSLVVLLFVAMVEGTYNCGKSESTGIDYLPCCETSSNRNCIDTCNKLIPNATDDTWQKIINHLEAVCGANRLVNDPWKCFILRSKPESTTCPSPTTRPSARVANSWCCTLAKTSFCYKQCMLKVMGDINDINGTCYWQTREEAMLQCIDQVGEPCYPTCSGLKFCKNFNRPWYAFRNCTHNADLDARRRYEKWNETGIVTFSDSDINAKNEFLIRVSVSNCQPEVWKALSCHWHIKPCALGSFTTRICRDSCLKLLMVCGSLAGALMGCSVTQPAFVSVDNTNCVDLSTFFTEPSFKAMAPASSRNHPCQPNPCRSREACVVNNDCLVSGKCAPFSCVPGCVLGPHRNLYTQVGQWIWDVERKAEDQQSLCRCSSNGQFDKCIYASRVKDLQCSYNNLSVENGRTFQDGNLLCTCVSGRVECSFLRRDVTRSDLLQPEPKQRLRCSCSDTYSPVCAENGRVYLNSCFARCYNQNLLSPREDCAELQCRNLSDISSWCHPGQQCHPSQRVCLSSTASCTQFSCVSTTCSQLFQPFCDSCSVSHMQPCSLYNCSSVSRPVCPYRKGCRWAYDGYCLIGCVASGHVCGMDGQTYVSLCAAQARHVAVDYRLPCQHFTKQGYINCTGVYCEQLPSGCQRLSVPTTCCPICGAVLTVHFNEQAVDEYSKAIGKAPLTVSMVISQLKQLTTLVFCEVSGFLSSSVLKVVIRPLQTNSSRWKVESCVSQAQILADLINGQHAIIAVQADLSVLTKVEVEKSSFQDEEQCQRNCLSMGSTLYSQLSLALLCVLLLCDVVWLLPWHTFG